MSMSGWWDVLFILLTWLGLLKSVSYCTSHSVFVHQVHQFISCISESTFTHGLGHDGVLGLVSHPWLGIDCCYSTKPRYNWVFLHSSFFQCPNFWQALLSCGLYLHLGLNLKLKLLKINFFTSCTAAANTLSV